MTRDLFGVAEGLRRIDDDYRVWYSYRRHRYEIHHLGQKGDTYALTVPYDCLDARTIKLVKSTRAENVEKLMRETEKANERLRKEKLRDVVAASARKAETALSKL